MTAASSGQVIMIQSGSTSETITIDGTQQVRILACGGRVTLGRRAMG